jgi:hypothetical protein
MTIGTHPITELPVFRRFTGEIKTDRDVQKVITVWYEEWQELPNGTVIHKEKKKYHTKDKPAVFDEDGNEISPTTNRYTEWVNYVPDGTKTLEQLFEEAINNTLIQLPIGFPDGGVI